MARRLYTPEVTTPAGTAEAAAQRTAIAIGPGTLLRLRVLIPPGHAGLTGIALEHGGRQLIPDTAGQWIVGDDEVFDFDTELDIAGSHVTILSFNSGRYDHTHYLRVDIDDRIAPAALALAPIATLPIVGLEAS